MTSALGFGCRKNPTAWLVGLTATLLVACGADDTGGPGGGGAAASGTAGVAPGAGAPGVSGNGAGGNGASGSGTSPGAAGQGAGAPSGGAGVGTAGAASGGGSVEGGSSGLGGGSAGGGGAAGASGGSGGTGGSAGSGGAGVDPSKLDKFSFFVTSMVGMQRLAKSEKGFGGDLRYGTADGLTGADKICAELAESSMKGASAKQWRAFLSTKKGPVHAKDRIGPGPWYDRVGRVVAMDLAGLLKNRPDADAAIKEDLPNELGIGNHRPNPNAPPDDNHHALTGSNTDGTLFTGEGNMATCLDWTSSSTTNTYTAEGTGRPRIGFSWSVQNRTNWISGQTEGGCGAGVTGVGTTNGGSTPDNPIVGSGGGYGAIYCFALVP